MIFEYGYPQSNAKVYFKRTLNKVMNVASTASGSQLCKTIIKPLKSDVA